MSFAVRVHRLPASCAAEGFDFALIPSVYVDADEPKTLLLQATTKEGARLALPVDAAQCDCKNTKALRKCGGREQSSDASPVVSQIVGHALRAWLERHSALSPAPEDAEDIIRGNYEVSLQALRTEDIGAAAAVTMSLVPAEHPIYKSFRIPAFTEEVSFLRKQERLATVLKMLLVDMLLAVDQYVGLIRQGRLLIFRIEKLKGKRKQVTVCKVEVNGVMTLHLVPFDPAKETAEALAAAEVSGFARIGGKEALKTLMSQQIIFPLVHPEAFYQHAGSGKLRSLRPPRGVLLYGPPGTGKSFMCLCLEQEVSIRWRTRLPLGSNDSDSPTAASPSTADDWFEPQIICVDASKLGTRGELTLAAHFERCRENFLQGHRMTLLILDEIDAICPKREEATPETIALTNCVLTHLDGVNAVPGLVLIATTNRPNALDEAIRRPGRIDREIELEPPSAADRHAILVKLLGSVLEGETDDPTVSALTPAQLRGIAERAHGYVPSDLELLCQRAADLAQTEAFQESRTTEPIRLEHLERALELVKPSALKELSIEVPKTRWSDIGGYEAVQKALKQSVEWPIKYAREFEALHLTPPKGILLYGPPGNSKTILAKAVATESSMNFISVKGPEIFSKWVGESERTVREIFSKARTHAPTVIFFDEIDAIGAARSAEGGSGVENRVLAQLLNEMDGIGGAKQVIIIAATNRPEALDSALLRPGRFDRLLYVSLPDQEARSHIFKIHLRNVRLLKDAHTCVSNERKSTDQAVSVEDWPVTEATSSLASMTAGFSGAEIALICTEAKMRALRQRIEDPGSCPAGCVQRSDLEAVIAVTQPRTSPESVAHYEAYAKTIVK